jgi:hypothetical protein
VRSAFTRYQNQVLAQLVYTVWFSERPKDGAVDSYAGALDGVVWRVTLDAKGQPLVYDTVHACGCYHYYFPAQALERREHDSAWDEPPLFPQLLLPDGPFVIRLQSGTHYVRRIVAAGNTHTKENKRYRLADYRELLTLPEGEGKAKGTRSLFDEDGIVAGSERMERLWLWPAGIQSAGAMRQWGRHATAFVGRSHFDDPDFMQRVFY